MTDQTTSLSTEEMFAAADADPERRARWEQLALARAAADVVLDYRVRHRLSQRRMAEKLGMKPSAVARLELGEHNPSVEMLQRLATALELRFVLQVAPSSRAKEMTVPRGLKTVEDVTATDGSRVLVAAG